MKSTNNYQGFKYGARSSKLMLVMLVLVSFLVCSVTFGWFTATANKSGSFQFANIELNIQHSSNSANATNDSFKKQLPTSLTPGDKISFTNLKINSTPTSSGGMDVYSLVKLDVNVKKSNESTASVVDTVWYNLSGQEVNIQNFASNATAASLVAAGQSVICNISYTFDGDTYTDDYKGAEVSITFNAYGVQTLLPTAEGSKDLYAVYLICKDAGLTLPEPT